MKKLTFTLVFLAAAACALPTIALAAPRSRVTVYAGPNLRKLPAGVSTHADALFFYPKTATVHVGDTVTWQFRGFHTVTFAGGMRPYPFVVAAGTQPATNDAAGQPFWWSGHGPLLAVSPLTVLLQGGPTISSPAQVRSSGLVRVLTATAKRPAAAYRLTFTKPGTYRYQCAVHPGMRGVVRVLRKAAPTPSAAELAARGRAELRRTLADARALGAAAPPPRLTVFAGTGHTSTGAEIASFLPSTLVVNVGDTVTFANNDETDIHTVTFGPDALRSEIEKTLVAPGPAGVLFNPLGALPSEPPGAPVQYDGANHGNGYLNAGILQPKGTPAAVGAQAFSVTFTMPGTYRYECVVHANMDGVVVVK